MFHEAKETSQTWEGGERRGGDGSGMEECHDYRESVCDLIYCRESGPEGPATHRKS